MIKTLPVVNLDRQLPRIPRHRDGVIARNRFIANLSANLDRAFPVGDARAAICDRFLFGHEFGADRTSILVKRE